jgi:alpha-tubulin suppressor-like RCC1 family protein
MALGDRHTCVLFEQGKTKCWGNNEDGQLGYGDSVNRSSPPEEYLKINKMILYKKEKSVKEDL